MTDFLIHLDLKDGSIVLANPLMDPSVLLEKVERKTIYNPRLRRYHEVAPKTYVFPIYLPELGVLLSLDTVSEDLARELYREAKDYEGILTKGKLFLCPTYNFRKEENRVVSWGNVKSIELSNRALELYSSNLLNDFRITPSIIKDNMLLSPHRWFFVLSTSTHKFEAYFNYNFGVIYVDREKLRARKVKKVWMNSYVKLYELTGLFIYFQPTGFVKAKPITLHFTEDPLESNLVENKGDYFIGFLNSFNNYSTSWDKADIKSGNINIVGSLIGLVYSPYEILPLLFPYMVEEDMLNRLVYSFSVSKSVFKSFCSRLTKFGSYQDPKMIREFEKLAQEKNALLRVEETDDNYHVEIVNPCVIPFLIKELHSEKGPHIGPVKKLLETPEILKEMKRLEELLGKFSNKEYREKHIIELQLLLREEPIQSLYRVKGSLIPKRVGVLREYIRIYKDLMGR